MSPERRIVLEFVDEGISIDAILLDDQAPKTGDAVWQQLPADGSAYHAIYSGSEVYFLFPETFVVPAENQTSDVLPADVAYYYQPGGRMYGFPDDLCEICFFYDRDAVPSMPSGPIQVNLFARMVGDTRPFFGACRRMRVEGKKRFRVTQGA
jgi:hypothetical protein